MGKPPLSDVGSIMHERINSTDCAKDFKHDFISNKFQKFIFINKK